MSASEPAVRMSDSELAVEMLKRKLVNESQLKAAIDYQESVGGDLVDILLKLGLVRQDPLERFMAALAEGNLDDWDKPRKVRVDPDKLTVHKKLVEKVPPAVVEEYGILLFFPPKGTRAILLSMRGETDRKVVSKLSTLLGVEIHPIDLDEEQRQRFLGKGPAVGRPAREPRPRVTQPSDESAPESADEPAAFEPEVPPRREPTAVFAPPRREAAASEAPRRAARKAPESSSDLTLPALVNLLIKKQLISRDELAVEMEFLRRREA